MLTIDYKNGRIRLVVDPKVLNLSAKELAGIVVDLASDELAIQFHKIMTNNLPEAKLDQLSKECGIVIAQSVAENKLLSAKEKQENATKPIIPVVFYDPNE